MRNLSDTRGADNLAEWHKPNRRCRPAREFAYAIRPGGRNREIVRYWALESKPGVNAMRKRVVYGALVLFGALGLAGCVSTPSLEGSSRAPSFDALQGLCEAAPTDYGADAQSVYSALYDAYVAQRRGGLSKERFCAF